MVYKALTIAGFDGSGGAGIQADLKTFSALGCYGLTALTAIPIQNTQGVKFIYKLSRVCIEEQIEALFDDIAIDAIKIGMLYEEKIIKTVAHILSHHKKIPLVLDPVMVAKSGDLLLHPKAVSTLKNQLLPLTKILTPNLLEASNLLRRDIQTKDQMAQAALDLLNMGPQAVVIKGGHLKGSSDDCLALRNPHPEIHWLSATRIHTKNTHGTGCTFSAAIAAFLAKGLSILESVKKAKSYISNAIQAGAFLHIGKGNGPVHHFHHLWN